MIKPAAKGTASSAVFATGNARVATLSAYTLAQRVGVEPFVTDQGVTAAAQHRKMLVDNLARCRQAGARHRYRERAPVLDQAALVIHSSRSQPRRREGDLCLQLSGEMQSKQTRPPTVPRCIHPPRLGAPSLRLPTYLFHTITLLFYASRITHHVSRFTPSSRGLCVPVSE